MSFKHLGLILFVALLVFAGCDKKDKFSFISDSADVSKARFELLNNSSIQIKLHLRDGAAGYGRAVKMKLEGLPPQIKATMVPDSEVIVTDAGADVIITLAAANAPDTLYPLTLRFTWEDGEETWQFPLYVVSYSAAKALSGSYSGSSACDSTRSNKPHITEITADGSHDRIKLRNFANLGDNVYVDATIDSTRRRIVVPQQTIGNVKLSAEGSYYLYGSQYNISMYGDFRYATTQVYSCGINMTTAK